MKTIPIHPLADLFPPMSEEELRDLVSSIGEHGLQHPITVYEGKVLDGRHRYMACKQAGVSPRFVEYKGKDALSFVISCNLDRRHLNTSQRALIAASIADMKQGEAGRKAANLRFSKSEPESETSPLTHTDAAERLNVSPRSVDTASRILDEAPKSVIKKVSTGAMSLNAAAKIVSDKKAKEKPVLDATGYPIPVPLHALWERRGEALAMMREIARIKNILNEAHKNGDQLFSIRDLQGIVTKLGNVHQEISRLQIHAVCTSCQGRNPQRCTHCTGRGYLSPFDWDHVPQSIKTVREKAQ